MKMNKRAVGVVGLAAVALIGGTFAYFTQTATIDNPFDTAKYETVVIEEFNPEQGKDWRPGAEINKDLHVENTGDRAVVVRVKFEDIWSRGGVEIHVATGSNALKVEQAVHDPGIPAGEDGETEGDKSVVEKIFAEGVFENGAWSEQQADGYFYYLSQLAPGTSTGKFLDSVKLAADADMGKFMTQYYYSEEASPSNASWKALGDPQPTKAAKATPPDAAKVTKAVTRPEEGKLGYSDADYVLRITIETVQATDKAVETVFGTVTESILSEWNLDKEDLEK